MLAYFLWVFTFWLLDPIEKNKNTAYKDKLVLILKSDEMIYKFRPHITGGDIE